METNSDQLRVEFFAATQLQYVILLIDLVEFYMVSTSSPVWAWSQIDVELCVLCEEYCESLAAWPCLRDVSDLASLVSAGVVWCALLREAVIGRGCRENPLVSQNGEPPRTTRRIF